MEFCIDYIDFSKKTIICNLFIKNLIENYYNKRKKYIENEQIMILLKNIDNIFVENVYMIEIVSYLFYLMINYEIINLNVFNLYENNESENINNIILIVKNLVSFFCKEFSDKKNNDDYLDCKKRIINEFKELIIFQKNKEIFEKCLDN